MKAKCLCGNVSLEVEHDKHVHACHCGMYRTWGQRRDVFADCRQAAENRR